MSYLRWWQGAPLLAAVPVLHWLLLGRTLAVSGRLTSLVDRARRPRDEAGALQDLSQEDLLAAFAAATAAEFGAAAAADAAPGPARVAAHEAAAGPAPETALAAPPMETAPDAMLDPALDLDPVSAAPGPAPSPPPGPAQHLLFFAGLTAGGALAARLTGAPAAAPAAAHDGALLLLGGGLLLGFGSRMAGGCTSGHGLCGTSRLQPGSLVATAAFFAAALAAAQLLLRLGALS